jgi:hypothetical protein
MPGVVIGLVQPFLLGDGNSDLTLVFRDSGKMGHAFCEVFYRALPRSARRSGHRKIYLAAYPCISIATNSMADCAAIVLGKE